MCCDNNFTGQYQGSHADSAIQKLVEELHCEPKKEIIMGCFIEKNISAVDINVRVSEPEKKKKGKTSLVEKPKGCQDIRKLFLKHFSIILFAISS